MNKKRLLFWIVLGIMLAVLLTLAIVVIVRYFESGRTEMQPAEEAITETTTTAPAATNSKAFVTIDRADAAASPGGAWTVDISSNSWSSCLADLYAPDETVSPFKDPKDAQATATGDGKFTWTWKVPADAAKGTWTVRILCGTYENLASRDATVEVR